MFVHAARLLPGVRPLRLNYAPRINRTASLIATGARRSVSRSRVSPPPRVPILT